MSYNFSEELAKNEKEYGMGQSSDNFEIQDGSDNVCRILTPGAVYATHFMGKGAKSPICYGYEKGCPVREKDEDGNLTTAHAKTSIRYVHFVLDRKDNKVKTAFLPYSVYKQVAALQKNPDYKFDDLPMPYDIRITYNKGTEDKNNTYRVEFKPNSGDVTESHLKELESKMSKMTPDAIVARMKEKQMEQDDRTGRRVSPEELQGQQAAYMQKAIENDNQDKPSASTVPGTSIEYPKEEINPADIPF